jgi:prophage DNA circulation protein
MALSDAAWRATLRPASLAGAGFHVEQGGVAGGRRIALHEFPKRDTPYAEDMGRKARRWSVAAYIVGPDYLGDRDALIAVCETEGPALLVHPTLGEMLVVCDGFSAHESRERGGFVSFELNLAEAGSPVSNAVVDDTVGQVGAAAANSDTAAAASLDKSLTFPGAAFGGGASGAA